jgi:O-antigen ligase
MNIVYACKIFIALSIVAWLTKMVCGPGLRTILSPKDFKIAWWGIVGTLAVSCFSVQVGLFFVTLPIWVLILSSQLGKDGSGRMPAYALLCCICPPMFVDLQHLGPLNDLMRLTPFRVLSLFLLLPEVFRILSRRHVARSPSWLTLCDCTTAAYAIYWLVRHFSGASISSIGREALGQLLDSLIPYFVISRACVDFETRRRFLGFVLLGATYEAMVGIVESASRHYLYAQLQWLYSIGWGQSTGLLRGSWLRAEAAFPGPLALAVLLTFALGIWFALKSPGKSRPYLVVAGVLGAGLLATYGRGPILAAGILLLGAKLLRHMSTRRYLVIMVLGAIVISAGWKAGIGDAVLSLVGSAPGGDETADFNVQYRQQLLTTSLALLQQSPWWGVPNFIEQMQDLRQGEGLIDLVNTYLVIALNSGLIGLVLVMIPFAVTLWNETSRATANLALQREGAFWIPLTASFMAAIFTVSPISIIAPIMTWVVALALARLQDRQAGTVDLPLPFRPIRHANENPTASIGG